MRERPETELATLPAAARIVGVDARTIKRWLRDGELAAFRPRAGGWVYVRLADVRRCVEARRVGPDFGARDAIARRLAREAARAGSRH